MGRDGDRDGGRRGGFGFDDDRGPRRRDDDGDGFYDGPSRADTDDWGKNRQFTPTAGREEPRRGFADGYEERGGRRGFDDGPRGAGFDDREDMGPSRADTSNNWGTEKKFVPTAEVPRDDRDMGPSRADTSDSWGRDKKFEPMPREEPGRGFGAPRVERELDWSRREALPPASADEPRRPRLQLQKRTVPVEEAGAPASGSSLFGDAKPVQVKEVEDKPREPVPQRDAGDSWGRREAPPPPPPASREDSWKRGAPEPTRDDAPPAGERPRLKLAPRSENAQASPADTGSAKASLFGGARPREELLKEQGRDWLKEELELARKAVSRKETKEEAALKKEVDALKAKAEGGDEAAKASLAAKEEKLLKLSLELDDKVRFKHGGGEKKKADGPENAAEAPAA